MKAIILAAGMGRRLNHGLPKCLTPLSDATTVLDLQLAHVSRFTDDIRIVVGYKKELVLARYPQCTFTHNDAFQTTNTARSLALALHDVIDGDVVWMNGDVIFSADVLRRVVSGGGSGMAVMRGRVGEEEVKYRTDSTGRIVAVSKVLDGAEGEAVGINLVRSADVVRLRSALARCDALDYFEKGIEIAIAEGLAIFERNVSDLPCIEVDFPEDLEAGRKLLPQCLPSVPV